MAVVRISVQDLDEAGVAPSYVALSAADTYLLNNDGRVMLHLKNTDTAAETVTVVTPGQVAGHAIADQQIQVPANTGDIMAGPFAPRIYNSGGDLSLSVANGTATTVAAVRL